MIFFHPKTFFLINNSSPTLTEGFDKSQITPHRQSLATPIVSSIPKRVDQTQEQSIKVEENTTAKIEH